MKQQQAAMKVVHTVLTQRDWKALLWQVDVHKATKDGKMAELELVVEWAPERINEATNMGLTPLQNRHSRFAFWLKIPLF